MKGHAYIFAFSLLACTGSPWAAGAVAGLPSFDDADTNRDGKVTHQEFDQSAHQPGGNATSARQEGGEQRAHDAFNAADANHDGALNRREWQTMLGGG